MSLAPYNAAFLPPGMGTIMSSAEEDNSGLFYGPNLTPRYLTYAVVDGASRDAGNTGFTTVLRPGLVMAQVTTGGKWKPFVSGASDGTQFARGILTAFGLSTQLGGVDTDRWLATILVGNACVNPEALCLNTTAAYGLIRTGIGLAVRKHLMYTIQMSDDFMNDLTIPLTGR